VAPDTPWPDPSTRRAVTVTVWVTFGDASDTEAVAISWAAVGDGMLVAVGGGAVGTSVGTRTVGVEGTTTVGLGPGLARGELTVGVRSLGSEGSVLCVDEIATPSTAVAPTGIEEPIGAGAGGEATVDAGARHPTRSRARRTTHVRTTPPQLFPQPVW
jgi:hypothetical protein